MAVFATSGITNLPRNIADGIVKKTTGKSVVAALSTQEPQRFGNTDIITFTGLPSAEFVGEGAQKSSTTGTFGSVTATPHKAQVTMRFNQEVEWADDAYQLQVLSTLASAGGDALARALDLGLLYRMNPLTNTAITAWTNYLNATTSRVELTSATAATPEAAIRSAVSLILAKNYPVNGMAIDTSYGFTMANETYTSSALAGQIRHPELGFGTNIQAYLGLPVASSNTVSGQSDGGADNKVKAIVGDFQNGIRWGVQQNIPVSMIRFGDPDGQGDLQRQNQVALRLEIVYGWYVFTDRFAVIEDQVANS